MVSLDNSKLRACSQVGSELCVRAIPGLLHSHLLIAFSYWIGEQANAE
jgi:hypothetical protein